MTHLAVQEADDDPPKVIGGYPPDGSPRLRTQ
jgi:hypothetical protein